MKFSLLVFIAIFAFAQNVGFSYAEVSPYDLLATECAAQEGASDDDIKAALAMEMPTTTPGKCLNACIGEKTGIMKNNKLDVEATIEMTKMDFSNDPETLKIVSDITHECADATDDDRCEAAYKIMKCTDDAARALGIVFER